MESEMQEKLEKGSPVGEIVDAEWPFRARRDEAGYGCGRGYGLRGTSTDYSLASK